MAFSPTDNGCTDEERAAALCGFKGDGSYLHDLLT